MGLFRLRLSGTPRGVRLASGQVEEAILAGMGDYRKLEVYQVACDFSDRVAALVSRLPRHAADNADQLRRAADSIRRAIAEGCGLGSDPQLLKYLRIALGSANESEDELQALDRRGFVHQDEQHLLETARRLGAMLASFIARVDSDISRAGQRRKRASRRPRADAERAQRQPSEKPI
jgi:four helix bundle protein